MKLSLNKRKVETEGIDGEVGEYAAVEQAWYLDTDTALTSDELDELNEIYADEIYQEYVEHMSCRAEDYFDFLNDR